MIIYFLTTEILILKYIQISYLNFIFKFYQYASVGDWVNNENLTNHNFGTKNSNKIVRAEITC